MKTQGFTKRERIVSQKHIDMLFSGTGSHSMAAFPVRVVYTTHERQATEPAAQILISVPKRRFKHAVDRNRVKRQLREAWRQHRQLLTDHVADTQGVRLAFIWLSDQHLASADVHKRMANLLHRMADRLHSNPSPNPSPTPCS